MAGIASTPRQTGTLPAHPPHGRHLLLTLTGCPTAALDDLPALENLVHRAAAATGATVLRVIGQRFAPQGVTVLAMLAESHASLHTYPDRGVAFWDCFTCGGVCDPTASTPILIDALHPTAATHDLVVRRG